MQCIHSAPFYHVSCLCVHTCYIHTCAYIIKHMRVLCIHIGVHIYNIYTFHTHIMHTYIMCSYTYSTYSLYICIYTHIKSLLQKCFCWHQDWLCTATQGPSTTFYLTLLSSQMRSGQPFMTAVSIPIALSCSFGVAFSECTLQEKQRKGRQKRMPNKQRTTWKETNYTDKADKQE